MLVIAHRGASQDAPENTLAAFRLAVEQGADMIETDLQVTTDGEIPLFHDHVVAGTPIAELSLAELRQRVPQVPTLQEALDAVGERIPFNLELKSHPDYLYPELPELALAELRARGLLDRTLFSCFYDPALARLRELAPDARIGLLVSRRSNLGILERARKLGAEAVHPELAIASAELTSELHDAGFRVHVFTVDSEADQRRLLEQGVDGLFTNLPARLRRLIDAP